MGQVSFLPNGVARLQCKMVSPSGKEDDCFLSQVGQVSFLVNKKGVADRLGCKMVSPSGREDDCFLSQVGLVSFLLNKNRAASSLECKMVSTSTSVAFCSTRKWM